jgi:hypothetical protein
MLTFLTTLQKMFDQQKFPQNKKVPRNGRQNIHFSFQSFFRSHQNELAHFLLASQSDMTPTLYEKVTFSDFGFLLTRFWQGIFCMFFGCNRILCKIAQKEPTVTGILMLSCCFVVGG